MCDTVLKPRPSLEKTTGNGINFHAHGFGKRRATKFITTGNKNQNDGQRKLSRYPSFFYAVYLPYITTLISAMSRGKDDLSRYP